MQMITNPLLDAARAYLERGFKVVPVPGGQKGPVRKGWQRLSIRAEELHCHFELGMNIGILLGEPSGGLVDVDLDCQEALDLADEFLPSTQCVTGRASAPRSHRWYFAAGASTKQHRDPSNNQMIVELRSTGAQTLVGPSIHTSGELYDTLVGPPSVVDADELAQAVANLAAAVLARRNPPQSPEAVKPADISLMQRATAYLDALPAGISGQGGHAATYRAATSLVHGFGLDPKTALDLLLTRFNPRCQPPWSESELQHKVSDAATKPHSRPAGWLRDAKTTVASDDALPQPSSLAEAPVDPGPFPAHLLQVPGFIDAVIRFNLQTATRPQPILALAGAIALQAVLAARKVRDTRGNRTNLYCVGVAPSGAGKDHARKVSKNILFDAGLGDLEANEDLASDSGLVSAVEIAPAGLFQFDEFGRFLRTIGDPKKAPHLYNVLTALMKLYSSASTTYKGKAYADPRRNKVIHQPCVVVYGTTVPEHFYESLTAESLSDGFMARLMVFDAVESVDRQRVPATDAPEGIIDQAKWWGNFQPPGNLQPQHPCPIVIANTSGADAVFDRLGKLVDEELSKKAIGRSLWTRCEEKACRLALVYACSANHEQPVIDEAAATWACDLSAYLTKRMLVMAHAWVAENAFEQKQKRILRIIREEGGSIGRWELSRRTQSMSQRERREVIDNMLEAQLIREVRTPSSTRPGVRYEIP